MHCLTDYIGFKWCQAPEPESGLYINELPGVSLKSVDQLANEEQATFLTIWKNVQKRALRQLASAFSSEFRKRYQLSQHSYTGLLQATPDTLLNQTPPAGEWRGVQITLHAGSALQLMTLQQAAVYLKAPATTIVKLINLSTAIPTTLASLTLNGTTGWNPLAVPTDLAGVDRLLLVYDATAVESVFTETPANLLCNQQLKIEGITANGTYTNLASGNNSFGVQVSVRLQCSYLPLLCRHKATLQTPLWYLLGAELMNERLHSDRLNRYTTIDTAKARELRDEFSVRFYRELDACTQQMPLTASGGCISCNGQIQSVAFLP